MSQKPKPLKVFGRVHYACTRCKLSKIKCSGEKPACANCKLVNKEDNCAYPTPDRKIVIMESDLNKLYSRVRQLEHLLKNQGPYTNGGSPPAPGTTDEVAESMVKHRMILNRISELYLLPDAEHEYVPHKLLSLCALQLPEENYAWSMIETVLSTYSSEFYLIDGDELRSLVTKIYQFFESTDLSSISVSELHALPPILLCYFFVILAFGEQMRNSTLELLPKAITEVTGGSYRIPGLDYYTTASKLFNMTHEETDIQFIQSALLLALFACNLNRYNTVYNYFGVAVRSAVANGYHRQMDRDNNISELQRVTEEKMRRLWWSIFVIDVVWAAKMNMPVHIDYTETDVALPNESPVLDLKDGFNSEVLECNVHLAKYVARFNRLIYGPNIRTFSMNYINTEKFNQQLLVKNIVLSLNEIVGHFEHVTLAPYKSINIFGFSHRNWANLFLRYNQVIIMVTKPLLALVFDEASAADIENNAEVVEAINVGIKAAIRTLLIMLKLYEHSRLFVLGFWDSQHLFSALLILTFASFIGKSSSGQQEALALLKFMADNNNINARNCLQKLKYVLECIDNVLEIDTLFNLNDLIHKYVQKRAPTAKGENLDFFNPFMVSEDGFPLIRDKITQNSLLYFQFGFDRFSPESRATLAEVSKVTQSWDSFRGLPIRVYGTGRLAPSKRPAPVDDSNPKNPRIQNLI